MSNEKKYYSIKEVSKIIGIEQHVIRHWDSVDPKTNKPRFEDLCIRTKGGTRFFNKFHINKLLNLKSLLQENGKRNYSLDLASKIISSKKLGKQIYFETNSMNHNQENQLNPTNKAALKKIINNLKILIN